MLPSIAVSVPSRRLRLRFVVLAAVLLAGLACLNALLYFTRGLPAADDLDCHLSYIQALKSEIGRGDYFPRWLPEINQGGGSPIFFLNYPIPYVVAFAAYAPLRLFTGPVFSDIAIPLSAAISLIVLAISGWMAYLWLREFTSQAAALLGALVFVAAPYHFSVDIYRRFALGEMTGYAAFPLLLLFTRRIASRQNWRGSLAGFALAFTLVVCSHLITAMIVAPVVLLELWLASGKRPVLSLAYRLAAAGAAGALLSAFYLFTFLSHYHEVDRYPFRTAPLEYDANYLFLPAVMFHNADAALDARASLPTPVKALGHRAVAALGVFGEDRAFPTLTPMAAIYSIVIALAAALLCIFVSPSILHNLSARAWLIAGLAATVLQWHGSHWLADHFTPMRLIQFPWRFSIITSTAVAVLAACAWDAIRDSVPARSRGVTLCAGLALLLGLGNWVVIQKFCPFDRQVKISGNDSAYEIYADRKVDELAARAGFAPFSLVRSTAPSSPSAWRPAEIDDRDFEAHVTAQQPAHVVLDLICFPSWTATEQATGKNVPIMCDPATHLSALDVGAGDTVVRFFLPLHRADYIGPAVSLVTALALLYFCIRVRDGRPSRHGA